MTLLSGWHLLDSVTFGAIDGSGRIDETPSDSSFRVFSTSITEVARAIGIRPCLFDPLAAAEVAALC